MLSASERGGLFLEAIRLQPDYAEAYVGLASTLSSATESVRLLHDGRSMTQRDLFIEALRHQ